MLILGPRYAGAEEATEDRPVIPWSQANQYIGEEVTIEGRIVATHVSPLSTLLSFDKSFNKFTAVIRPADRKAFPPEPEEYYRGKQVRIKGRVVEYEKKAEIVLKSRDQIQVVEPKAVQTPPVEETNEAVELTLEVLERLTGIESKLETIANHLEQLITALEQQPEPERPAVRPLPGQIPRVEPPPRPRHQTLRGIKRGMRASQVEQLVGTPAYIDATSEGGEIWYYGGGRTVSFDNRGRLEAMAGFQNR
jgi:hypothetical protein